VNGTGTRTRRRRIALGVGAVALLLALWSLTTPDNLGGGPLTVLRRFLSASGLDVRDGADPPSGGGAFFLVIDGRTADEEVPLLSWVNGGGRLVVADPGSELFARFGVTSERAGIFGSTDLLPSCVRPESDGVGAIRIASTDRLLTTSVASMSCFSSGGRGFVLFIPHGRGTIVLLGGPSPFSDDLLREADNAVFVRSVLDAEGPVVFGPPLPPTVETRSFWSLVPTRAKAVVWELVVAGLFFMVARGRRLGRPVPEEPVSPLASSELVTATAGLYRRAGATAFCANLVRGWTGDRLAGRLGIPPDPDRRRLAATIAVASGQDHERVERVLAGPEPSTDDELVALCRELDSLSHAIEGAQR
jgi:uncharacterized protein DUF4350